MNCSECEQLFDTYLDGGLRGSLRLEFDAHRVRCAQCQQTLAMLETIGNVVAAEDPELPELSSDFSDRVLQRVQPSRTVKFPRWRVAVVGAAVLQAAAAVTFAIIWSSAPDQTLPPVEDAAPPARVTTVEQATPQRPGDEALKSLIIERIEDRLLDMRAAGATLSEDLLNLARYANIELPPDVAQDSVQVLTRNPWDGLWNAVLFPAGKPAEPDAEDAGDAENVYSI